MSISRRSLLTAGVAGAGLLGLGTLGVLEDVLPGGAALRRAVGATGEDGTVPPRPPKPPHALHPGGVAEYRVRSAARGTDVDLVTMIPPGPDPATLPVCVALHGRGGSARGWLDLGLPNFLLAAIGSGMTPFAIVAVDGGDSYWVPREPGEDPQAMLRTELPRWLTERGLTANGGVPAMVLGISMGCFGGLAYADGRQPTPPAVAALSPALFRSWGDANAVHAFADQAQWARFEPLRNGGPLPRLGVWCGQSDPFIRSARQLATQRNAEIASFDRGEHTDGYWRRVLPDALRFLSPPR